MPTKTPLSVKDSLPYDILWYIFALNATDRDEDANFRLDTTRQSSQVCVKWRHTLLNSPSIWSRLLVFDNRQTWRGQVLLRSKDAPLWVSGDSSSWTNETYHLFFQFLDTYWERLEQLVANLGKSAGGNRFRMQDEKEILRFTHRRAPLLKSFAVSFNSGCFDEFTGALPQVSFACDAPLLSTFICKVYRPPTISPWHSNIRSLSCFLDGTIEENLQLLRSMPLLEKLDLSIPADDAEKYGIVSTSSLPTTKLEFLTHFHIRTSLQNFLLIKDHLVLPDPDTCEHAYQIEMDSGSCSLPRLLEDLGTTLQKHIKSAMASMKPQRTMLGFDYTSEHLSLSMKGINTAIRLSWSGLIPTKDIFKRILNSVHSPYLDTVTCLRMMESHFQYQDVDYTEQIHEFLLSALPSVTEFFAGASFWRSSSAFIYPKDNTTNILFSKLNAIYIDRSSLTATATKQRQSKRDGDVISFLQSRKDAGLFTSSISIITSKDPSKMGRFGFILREFNGTQVFWSSGRLLEYNNGWKVANSPEAETKLYETIGRQPRKGFTDEYIKYIRSGETDSV